MSTLIDRWRLETHTFHFRWGEMAVALQDVLLFTGLPIRGKPLVPGRPSADGNARLGHRFNIPVPDSARGVPRTWLRNFSQCPPDAPDEVVRAHLVAYLLYLFDWALFSTTQDDWMYLNFVCNAEFLANAEAGVIPWYSWGSVVLYATCRALCDASRRDTGVKPVLAFCYMLLQLWSESTFVLGGPPSGEQCTRTLSCTTRSTSPL